MKSLIFVSLIVLVFSGCTQDVKSLTKQECKNQGYTFVEKKQLNYRTGKYELASLCKENKRLTRY